MAADKKMTKEKKKTNLAKTDISKRKTRRSVL